MKPFFSWVQTFEFLSYPFITESRYCRHYITPPPPPLPMVSAVTAVDFAWKSNN